MEFEAFKLIFTEGSVPIARISSYLTSQGVDSRVVNSSIAIVPKHGVPDFCRSTPMISLSLGPSGAELSDRGGVIEVIGGGISVDLELLSHAPPSLVLAFEQGLEEGMSVMNYIRYVLFFVTFKRKAILKGKVL